MTTTYDFLADIIANPADDTPRLIYADWLEENGEEDYASFIRVQGELAKPLKCELMTRGLACQEYNLGVAIYRVIVQCHACTRYDNLRRRERELLSEHQFDWRLQIFGRETPFGRWTTVFRRGFVTEIACTLADWCGTVCGQCRGRGEIEGADWDDGGPYIEPCYICHGSGRIDAHGPALVRAAPLEQVTLTDRSPGWTSTHSSFPSVCGWQPAVDPPPAAGLHPTASIPLFLFDSIEGFLTGLDTDNWYSRHWKFFCDHRLAHSALSAACLAWALCAP